MNQIDKEMDVAIKNFDVEKAEEIIERRIKNDNRNIKLWFKLAVIELTVPLVDYIKSLECVNKILDIDKNNVLAVILECCIHHYHLGGINEDLFNKLNLIRTNDNDVLSMIKYIMSLYYEDLDINKQKELLEQSICLCNDYVTNYEELGNIYIIQGDLDKGKKLIKKAYDNIKLVYNEEELCDFTDVNEYINEHVKGIHLSWINKERIRELLN